jgi:hypothetical protein
MRRRTSPLVNPGWPFHPPVPGVRSSAPTLHEHRLIQIKRCKEHFVRQLSQFVSQEYQDQGDATTHRWPFEPTTGVDNPGMRVHIYVTVIADATIFIG